MARPTRPSPHPAILILEDEPDIRALVAEVLRDAGYRPAEAATEGEALALLAAVCFALVLADPPAANLASLVPLLAAAGDTPVVLCTARDPGAHATWRERGFAGFLAKPFDVDELLAAVARLLPPPRATCARW